jgi:hypothetical protein
MNTDDAAFKFGDGRISGYTSLVKPVPGNFLRPITRLALVLGTILATPAWAAAPATETILLVRHGEKPELGLGQLDCQGLNRALALPAVIAKQFGKPAAILAPDPSEQKTDSGKLYDYVRPLATVEPTAVAFGLPIAADIGVSHIDALEQKLEGPGYRDALVLIGWEHHYIVDLARSIVGHHGGDPATVPDWKGEDFDSIYVIRIMRTDQGTTARFERRHEGLDGQPTRCPGQS